MNEGIDALTVVLNIVSPVVGFIASFLVNWYLQSRKAREQLLRALARDRAHSLKDLWALTRPFARAATAPTGLAERTEADTNFRKWYFDEGGALYLSWRGTKRYFKALQCLRSSDPSAEKLEDSFSLVRTQLKRDLGIYTWLQGFRGLPPSGEPLSQGNAHAGIRQVANDG